MGIQKVIGVVGGVGPFAGVDLVKKIFEQTESNRDQDHLPVIHWSIPGDIVDRTSFLMGETRVNPAYKLAEMIQRLEQVGAGVVGIPCNTVHAPQIFDVILDELEKVNSGIRLLNIIDEVTNYIGTNFPGVKNAGVLSTTGLYKSGVYRSNLEGKGFNVVLPDEFMQQTMVHNSIYHPEYGIKAKITPLTSKARKDIYGTIDYLREQGAGAIILGCTEICLAVPETKIGDTVIIDSTKILARALIRAIAPDKLKRDIIDS